MTNDKEAALSHAVLLERMHYDPETGIFTRKASGRTRMFLNWKGYYTTQLFGKNYQCSRLAWFYVHARWPRGFIDHINGIRADNRICNLRECSRSQNMENQRKARRDSKTGVIGVSRFRNKFKAVITAKGKRIHLGHFDTQEEAATAYLSAKATHHEFSTLPPPPVSQLSTIHRGK